MLKLENITKIYEGKNFKQIALNDVTLAFRNNEFVSILGPSGSGKTTLLNIIGGLDKYTYGNLIIDGVSTRKYKERDWNNYRSNKVGFIFQSYNLINHQTVLSNVLLSLNIAGKPKKESIKLAKKVLKDVGLENYIKKKPKELSGGQMQRVAIARALVTNPDIILCDEPTGALDSQTSIQIMELLKEISKEKLVIMVTHNVTLANKYSDRVIALNDGVITYDTSPYEVENYTLKKIKNKRKTMNKFTSLSLSFNNLLTKKSRTLLTSFAGSIGIIGIALVLSLSKGTQKYINKIEKNTFSKYPISIMESYIDYQNMFDKEKESCKNGSICSINDLSNNVVNDNKKNSISKFSNILKQNYENINNYTLDINYNYNIDLNIYKDNKMIENSSLYFKEFLNNNSPLLKEYTLIYGKLPEKYNEIVIVTDENGKLSLSLMKSLFLNEDIDLSKTINISYEKIIDSKFKLVSETSYYIYENDTWQYIKNNRDKINDILDKSINLKITGILKLNKDAVISESGFIGYSKKLINYLNDEVNSSNIKKSILKNKDINPLTNNLYDENMTYEMLLDSISINDKNPIKIDIYPKDYKSKEKIEGIIKKYNEENSNDKVYYTDYLKVFLNSITSLIKMITYVLTAFIGVSLIVSSIMISIITYISVLERTKEIGILRSLGASKKDIKNIFKAETIIIGTISGVIGVGVTLLLNKVIDKVIYNIMGISHITYLPWNYIFYLILISIVLCLISGLVPAKIASKKDPVITLRSE
ncbi:aBC transporter permease/ATP-binding protein [Mycoplasma sp. CAG:472]|nr:aBC transporter permease/ATP-binding protein [Mycoplasma sp. CAG:472]